MGVAAPARSRTPRDVAADAQALLDALGPPAGVTATVAALLQASRAAHQQFLRLSHHWTPSIGTLNPNADFAGARAQLQQAAQLRAYAQILDPTHSDPAWAQETGTNYEHENLLSFYRRVLVEGAPFGGFRR